MQAQLINHCWNKLIGIERGEIFGLSVKLKICCNLGACCWQCGRKWLKNQVIFLILLWPKTSIWLWVHSRDPHRKSHRWRLLTDRELLPWPQTFESVQGRIFLRFFCSWEVEVLVVILLRGLVYVLMCTAPDLLISWELSRLHSVPKYSFPPPQDLTLYFYILPSTLKLVLKRYLQIHIYIICIWLIIEFSTVTISRTNSSGTTILIFWPSDFVHFITTLNWFMELIS